MSAAARLPRIGGALILAMMAAVVLLPDERLPRPPGFPTVTAVPLATDVEVIGPFTLRGAWRLDSPDHRFHGLSGLAILPDGRFVSVSDRGWRIMFPKPGPKPGKHGPVALIPARLGAIGSHNLNDLESIAVDPDTGTQWVGFENLNAIGRFDMARSEGASVQPVAMASWPANQGTETLIRLADGRFVVISEAVSDGRSGSHPALIFAGDPVSSAMGDRTIEADPMPHNQPRIFHFAMPNGFRPVDGKQIADGRVLILGRRFSVLSGFSTSIAIADPDEIRWGGLWQAREMARIDGGPLADNYEGMAVESMPDGATRIWLVSDDNLATIIQHQYLLLLHWPAAQSQQAPPAQP